MKKLFAFFFSGVFALSIYTIPISALSAENLSAGSDDYSISAFSDTGLPGPTNDGVKKKTTKTHTYKEWSKAGTAAAFIATLMGMPVADALTYAGGTIMVLTGFTDDVYYTRTLYECWDGTAYYYEYQLYEDSRYSKKLGDKFYSQIYTTIY